MLEIPMSSKIPHQGDRHHEPLGGRHILSLSMEPSCGSEERGNRIVEGVYRIKARPAGGDDGLTPKGAAQGVTVMKADATEIDPSSSV
jgi:hypothetical protein